jgi:GT2 family glycosyltransferase
VIVVDNNSNDGILESFRKKYDNRFRFFQNERNGGFAHGCNLGASDAKGEYLLFLNPDTVASEDSIGSLLESARRNPPETLVSCRQNNSNGKEKKAYGNFAVLGMLTGPGRALARLFNGKKLKPSASETMIMPDWISGSVIMISKVFFDRLGGFDEDYWMYFEDMDLCRRARNAGGQIFYLTNVTIMHDHGGSSRINTKTTALTKTEVIISRHIYVGKNLSGFEKLISHSLLFTFNMLTGFINALPGLILFFVPKLFVRTLIFLRLVKYYTMALLNGSWKSPLSVNSS